MRKIAPTIAHQNARLQIPFRVDCRLREAVRDIVHQAALSAKSYTEVAALTAQALATYTDDPAWTVIAAKSAAMHLRTVKGAAATLSVPGLGLDIPAPAPIAPAAAAGDASSSSSGSTTPAAAPAPEALPRPHPGKAFSVVVCKIMHEDVATPAPSAAEKAAMDKASSDVRLSKTAAAAVAPLNSTFDSGLAAEVVKIVAQTRVVTGLSSDSDADFCQALKERLTREYGSTWGVVLAPDTAVSSASGKEVVDPKAVGIYSPSLSLPAAATKRFLHAMVQGLATPTQKQAAEDAAAEQVATAASSADGTPEPASDGSGDGAASGSATGSAPSAEGAKSASATSAKPAAAAPSLPHQRYRLFVFQLQPDTPIDERERGKASSNGFVAAWRYAKSNGWTLTRMSLYLLAAACIISYFAYGHAFNNRCARPDFVKATSSPFTSMLTGGSSSLGEQLLTAASVGSGNGSAVSGVGFNSSDGASSSGASSWEEADAPEPTAAPQPLPHGCTLADAEAAEWRLNSSPALMYAGLAALVLVSLLRMVHGSVRKAQMKALLKGMATFSLAVAAAGGPRRPGGGGKQQVASDKKKKH